MLKMFTFRPRSVVACFVFRPTLEQTTLSSLHNTKQASFHNSEAVFLLRGTNYAVYGQS